MLRAHLYRPGGARNDVYRFKVYPIRLVYVRQCKMNDLYGEHNGICVKGSVIFGYICGWVYVWYSSSFSNEGIINCNQYKESRDVISSTDTKFNNLDYIDQL